MLEGAQKICANKEAYRTYVLPAVPVLYRGKNKEKEEDGYDRP